MLLRRATREPEDIGEDELTETKEPLHWTESAPVVQFETVERRLPLIQLGADGVIPRIQPPNIRELTTRLLRQPEYAPHFAQDLIDTMQRGFTMTAWRGNNGLTKATTNLWQREHLDFARAVSLGAELRQLHFESLNLNICETGGKGSQAVAVGNTLRYLGSDDWADPKQKLEVSGQLTLASLVEASFRVIPDDDAVIDGSYKEIEGHD